MAIINILFEVRPYQNGVGPKTITMASAYADDTGTQLDGRAWEPLIVSGPTYSFGFTSDQNGLLAESVTDLGTIQFRIGDFYDNEIWSTYNWNNAPCRVWIGEQGKPFTSYRKLFEATASGLERDGVTATVALRALTNRLNKPLLDRKYSGTGKAEGPKDQEGAPKPIAIGECLSVEPVIVDAARWIYQVHGYGAVRDIKAVYDFAMDIGPADFSVSTYDELAALTLVPGQWAKCNQLGMFRLGAASEKKISADVDGAIFNGIFVDRVDTIVPALLGLAGFKPNEIGSFAALSDRPWSFFSTESTNIGDICRKAVLDAGGYLFNDNDGVWVVADAFVPKAAKPLLADGSAEPSVGAIKELNVADPLWKFEVGYGPCWGVHSTSDISPKLLELANAIADQDEAIEEIVQDVIKVEEKVDEVVKEVEQTRKQMPDLVTHLLVKPIDDLSALNLKYGASIGKAAKALSDANLVAIRRLETRVEENGDKVAEDILQLTSRVDQAEASLEGIDVDGAIEAGLVEIRRTIAGLDFASAEEVDIKIANYGTGVTAWQNEEQRVRAEADSAMATDIDELGTRITTERGEINGAINDLRELIVDGEDNSALALRIDEMGVRIDDEVMAREAAIRTVEKAFADADKATADRVDTLSSTVEGVVGPTGSIAVINGLIQTIQQTEADNDGARAREITSLQSRLDNFNGASLEQAFNTYANKVDGVGAQYTLKVQTESNGVIAVAGMGLAAENGVSAISFLADSFRIMTPGETPRQVFYADANGLLAPELTVGRLTYGALVDQFAGTRNNLDPNGGWQDIPGGLIVMWGRYRGLISRESSFSIIFPKAFPNQCFMAIPIGYIGAASSFRDLWVQNVGLPSASGATFFAQAATSDNRNIDGIDWIAFGN